MTTEPASPAAVDAAERPARDPFFDNAKYLGILLVVMAHSWEPLRSNRTVMTAYGFVYLFHMPAFIMIAGYFARGFDFSRRKLRRLVTSVVVPYFVFETAYTLYAWRAGKGPLDMSYHDPYFLTWFLLALFLWRVTTPLWERLPLPLLFATAVSLGVGLTHGVPGDYLRALTLLPFFVVGLTVRPSVLVWLRTRAARLIAVFVLAAGVAAVWELVPRVTHEWVYWRADYSTMKVTPWVGIGARAAMLGLGLVLTAAFLALVPRRRTWFTALGAGSLYAYLLHGFAIKATLWGGAYKHIQNPIAGWALATVLAVVLATVLMTPPVRWLTRWAVDPKVPWLFGRDKPRRPQGRHLVPDATTEQPWHVEPLRRTGAGQERVAADPSSTSG